jgi:hypothetical protein
MKEAIAAYRRIGKAPPHSSSHAAYTRCTLVTLDVRRAQGLVPMANAFEQHLALTSTAVGKTIDPLVQHRVLLAQVAAAYGRGDVAVRDVAAEIESLLAAVKAEFNAPKATPGRHSARLLLVHENGDVSVEF